MMVALGLVFDGPYGGFGQARTESHSDERAQDYRVVHALTPNYVPLLPEEHRAENSFNENPCGYTIAVSL